MTVTDIFTCTEKSRAYGVTKEGASFDEKALKAWESPDLGRILLCGAGENIGNCHFIHCHSACLVSADNSRAAKSFH